MGFEFEFEKSLQKKGRSERGRPLNIVLGNSASLNLMYGQTPYASRQEGGVIQRVTDQELFCIAELLSNRFGYEITVDQVVGVLQEYYRSSGERDLRSWLSRVDAGWALDTVEATLLHTPRPQYFQVSFGDKDLEGGRRAWERGETPIATYLEPGDGMERNRDIIDEAGGQVLGDVRIEEDGITREWEAFQIPSPPEATTASFDFPWTTGMPTNPGTVKQVQKLTSDYGRQMRREGVSKMSMTVKAFQVRKGKPIKAPNRQAYTLDFPGFFPETIEHADPEMGHSKTRGGETTVHPDREGVTITYGNFEIMYGPLCDAARSFSSEPNEDNARQFEHFLQRDVFGETFPPDLRDDLVESAEDLLRCAHLILTYEPQPVSLDDAEEFKPRPRRPDDDRAYRRQGFSDISFL